MFLESFIVSHGYFDVFHFKYPLYHLIQYFAIWGGFIIFYYLLPSICFFIFLFMSKKHFDNDIKNVFEMMKYIDYEAGYNKLRNLDFTIKNGSILFLSTIVTKYNYHYWYESLYLIGFSDISITIIINLFTSMIMFEILGIKKNRFEKVVCISILLLGTLIGPFNMMMYYMAFIHAPLSLYHTSNYYFGNYCILLRYTLMICIVGSVNLVNIFIWLFVVKKNIYLIEQFIPMIVVPLLQTHIILHNTNFF